MASTHTNTPAKVFSHFFLLKNPFFWSGIQINILLRNLLQQYIFIGNIIIGFHLDAILININIE